MHGFPDVPMAIFESYCFIQNTYTHVHLYNRSSSRHSTSHAHPGVSTGQHGGGGAEAGSIYHNYYQWVGLLLIFQAVLCYLPWSWWKSEERGRVGKLIQKLSKDPLTEVPVEEQVAGLSNFIINNSRWFDKCALTLMVAQFMCLIFTIIQLYLIDIVLGNQFLHLGTNLLDWYELDIALEKVFPIVVKCSMNYFGPSGNVQNVNGMCNLPINILNEKIYLIVWVWYLFMIIITVFHIIGQIMVLITPYLRQLIIQRDCKRIHGHQIKRMTRRCSYGDYILLRILAHNIDTTQFHALISNLCDSEQINYVHHNPTLSTQVDARMEQFTSPEKLYSGNNNNSQNRILTKDL